MDMLRGIFLLHETNKKMRAITIFIAANLL